MNIWCKQLTLIKLITYLLKHKRKGAVLFYSQISLLVRLLLVILNKCKVQLTGLKPFSVQLGVNDEEGKALIYSTEEDIRRLVELSFAKEDIFKNIIPEGLEHYSDEWSRIIKSFLCYEIRDEIIFVHTVNWHINNTEESQNSNRIWIDNFLLARALVREDFSLNINNSLSYSIWPSLKNCLKYFPIPGRLIKLFIQSVITQFSSEPKSLRRSVNESIVFEEYIHSIFLRYPREGHLYWHYDSAISPNRVILSMTRPDSAVTKENCQKIESHRMGWVNLSNKFSWISQPVRIFFRSFKSVKGPKHFRLLDVAVWQTLISYTMYLKNLTIMFEKFHCKAAKQHQECTPYALLQTLAIRMAGGISFWNHWSVDQYPIAHYYYGFSDLIFSWGPITDGYFNAHHYSYKYLVQTGMIGGGKVSDEDQESGNDIRRELSNKVDFVITLFDSTHGDNWAQSTASMKYFYQEVLAMVDKNSKWGVIIKPKGRQLERILSDDEIKQMIDKLKAEDRLLILDGKSQVVPAAYAGDISLHYGIATTGIIAAVAGKKAIHWDLSGNAKHPFYCEDVANRLIFRDSKNVERALMEVYENKQSFVGDHTQWLKLFDAFCDNEGPQRAGRFIGQYMKNVDDGQNSDEALKAAVMSYKEQWGEDKVSDRAHIQKHLGNKYWQQIMDDVQGKSKKEIVKETEMEAV